MTDDCISVRAHRMLAWAGDILGIDADHRNDWRFDSAQKDVIRTLNDIRVGGAIPLYNSALCLDWRKHKVQYSFDSMHPKPPGESSGISIHIEFVSVAIHVLSLIEN